MTDTCHITAHGPVPLVEISARPAAWSGGLADAVQDAADGATVLVLSPDRRLVLLADEPLPIWWGAVAAAGGKAVDVGHAWRLFQVAGPEARALLERGIALDLDPRHFVPNQAAQTLCARTPVILFSAGIDLFHLYAATSYADWLSAWLRDTRETMTTAIGEGIRHVHS